MTDSIKEQIIDKIDFDENLGKLIEGKRVCICGPSLSQMDTKLGEEIDSYDIVCRVNMHLPFEDQEDYGKRTDVMFLGGWPIFDGNLRKELIKYDKEDKDGVWEHVIEDAKGVETPEFKLKKKLMKAVFDIDIYLSKKSS